MFRYRWISQTRWLLRHIDEETIVQVWLGIKHENPEMSDEQVGCRVESHFGIRNRQQTNLC
jgi:hypothetical protein